MYSVHAVELPIELPVDVTIRMTIDVSVGATVDASTVVPIELSTKLQGDWDVVVVHEPGVLDSPLMLRVDKCNLGYRR